MQVDEATKTIALAQRLRTYLQQLAVCAEPTTYKALADNMQLTPPKTIHQVTEALEYLMKEDAANEHPFVAALVISRARSGLPGRGFFEAAHQLGRFDGEPSGSAAATFHKTAFAQAVAFWSSVETPETDDNA
jgi:hypothetical protein